ncbi:transketolase [Gonapodya prolifera JEL478]|uniref:transketolase n=1 Tax=Gonapodya prolifera (strain JEL478) TaxID=1344416 RepID=A0A138ZZX8_GONPJ|nr:transketolase [Gonapodya prolifera JEL478]|eukprot:KXS10060.1 transketolase [Gonapodya prolifera JEL478]
MTVNGHSSFTDVDRKAVNTIRVLGADTVRKANSGHPGAPIGCAPMAHVLFTKYLKANPTNSHWLNRDRFILSNGHGSALQYVMLHLLGYKMSIDDLKSFRQMGSNTPGHPEVHLTDGVEVTTGPLGQGISMGVGLAAAERHLAATFNKPDFPVVDNNVFVMIGDGCFQEGVACEAASLAGHLKLGNLIVLYDANNIQIDGEIDLTFTEDVNARHESYGWHTQTVEDGDSDLDGIAKAIEAAIAVKDKPSLITIRTTIGYGSQNQGTEKVHGVPLEPKDIAEMKKKFGFDPEKHFHVEEDVYELYAAVRAKGVQAEKEWNALYSKFAEAYPAEAAEFERRLIKKELPKDFEKLLPVYDPSGPQVATRVASLDCLNALTPVFPELFGGSADLTGSNSTGYKGKTEFQPDGNKYGNYAGRYVRFGVREHGMAAFSNGVAAYGGIIPFNATYLNFITYAAGAIRLSALSRHQVLYITTHDSIAVGEDGRTHQASENIPWLRALPNLYLFRPADGNETAGSYAQALKFREGPSVFAFSKQNLPRLSGTSADKVAFGAYILSDVPKPDVVLVATGSEVSLIVETAKLLASEGIQARVVSAPCLELFAKQSLDYQRSVLGEGIPVVSAEAAGTFGWQKWAHVSHGVDWFGASSPYELIFKKFGLVPDVHAQRVKKAIEFYKIRPVPALIYDAQELLGKVVFDD